MIACRVMNNPSGLAEMPEKTVDVIPRTGELIP
jgi:hypothetical protein